MSTTQALSPIELTDRGEIDYRPVNTVAIASVVFGVLSVLMFVAARDSVESAVALSLLPLIGAALGLLSLKRIRTNPDHYTGAGVAVIGMSLSGVCLFGGLAFAGYVHATEVPDGYIRTSFAEMKPDEVDLRGGQLIPPGVAALDGKKVFIKGYFRPDSSPLRKNVSNFLLVRDNNQCCFGDLNAVQYYDQIAVVMDEGKTVDFSSKLFRMGGELHVRPENATNGSRLPVYILKADHSQ